MANSTSPLSRWHAAIIVCAALLFSPRAMADALFGMATVATPTGPQATPVAIDPLTGTETLLTPGQNFSGGMDVAVSGNTLFFFSSSFPSALQSVDLTTGNRVPIGLDHPIQDMAVEAAGAVTAVPVPATLPLFATGLAALSLLHWRRKRTALAA